MKNKRPKIKLTVGSFYYAHNTPDEAGEFNPKTFEETIESPVIKSVGTTENAENGKVISSGKDYTSVSQTSGTELEVEVVAFSPDDLAILRAEAVKESGLIYSGRTGKRPYFAVGLPVIKQDGGVRYTWYPKCQLVENTDDVATSEESFSEQNDTLSLRAYAFNDEGDIKVYVDNETSKFPEGLTEKKFFAKPIITDEDLAAALEAPVV